MPFQIGGHVRRERCWMCCVLFGLWGTSSGRWNSGENHSSPSTKCIESLTLFCSLTDGVGVLLFGLPRTRIVRSASCFVHKRDFWHQNGEGKDDSCLFVKCIHLDNLTKWRMLGGQSIKSAGHYTSVHLQLAGCRALAVCSACVAGSCVHITG